MNPLLNLMLSNALVAAVLFAILMLLRRWIKNPAVMHLFLLLILVKLITPAYWQPQFDLLSTVSVSPAFPEEDVSANAASEVTPPNPTTDPIQPVPQSAGPPPEQSELTFPGLNVPAEKERSTLAQSITNTKTEEAASITTWWSLLSSDTQSGTELFARLFMLAWITGTTGWFLLAFWRIIRFQKYLRQALPASKQLNQIAAELAARIGLKSAPQIQMVSGNVSPLLWACFSRARIILPNGLLEQLNEAEIKTLLLHELAHYRRGDHCVRLIELLATGVYWWNPVLWLVRREIRNTEEACCDAWVVQTLPDQRRAYAEVLVKAIGYVSRPQHITAATGMGSQQILEQRLKSIMCETLSGNISRLTKIAIVVIALVLLPFAPMLGQPTAETVAAQDKRALPAAEEILAGYRANFKKLMPVEMTYRVLTQENMNCINEDRRQLKGLEMLLNMDRAELENAFKVVFENTDVNARQKDEYFRALTMDFVRKKLLFEGNLTPEAIQSRLKESLAERRYLWTDGKSFHQRWSTDEKALEANLKRGPVWPAENLNTHYHAIKMISWSDNQQLPMRHWYGNGPDNRSTRATIGNKLSGINSFKTIAPLGLKELPWKEIHSYGLDNSMSESPDHYQVIGRAKFRGRPVILMDGFFTPGGEPTELRYRMRAWVDPAQGYLPLRMEWALVDDANKVVRGLHQETEVLEVKKVADGYYPVRIKFQEYTFDSLGIEKQIKEIGVENLGDRPLPDLPLVPGRVKIWEATEFTPRKAIDPATLALEFPKGTLYENEIDGGRYRAGDPKPIPPPLEYTPKLQVGDIAPPLEVASWLDGKSRSLDDFRGKVVVLLFVDIFAFSDIPDDMQLHLGMKRDLFKKIQMKYAAQGVAFLEIHPVGTTTDQVRAYQKFRQPKTLAAIDAGTNAKAGTTINKYTDLGEMNAFLIGRDGRIIMSTDSAVDYGFESYCYYAATKLNIPIETPVTLPEEDMEEAMHQIRRILEFIISEQLDRALAVENKSSGK
ncbi:M56 family metallopeptidase [uncultured Gimesia sp.]|uniref:M56 family metallopeptidase n=1 Tax=uncultured Gimesia sp. TaxID=1678688 RepID=UPI0030DD3895